MAALIAVLHGRKPAVGCEKMGCAQNARKTATLTVATVRLVLAGTIRRDREGLARILWNPWRRSRVTRSGLGETER